MDFGLSTRSSQVHGEVRRSGWLHRMVPGLRFMAIRRHLSLMRLFLSPHFAVSELVLVQLGDFTERRA